MLFTNRPDFPKTDGRFSGTHNWDLVIVDEAHRMSVRDESHTWSRSLVRRSGWSSWPVETLRRALAPFPPQQNAAFVCAMEHVLGVYTRPHDPLYPVICMDESIKQCVQELRSPLPMSAGHSACYDAEYERNGVGHLLTHYAPFDDWRRTDVAAAHTGTTWAEGVRRLVEEDYPEAQRITLVMANLSTHTGASLHKTVTPAHARALLDKLEFSYTPKHRSWLNMARARRSQPVQAPAEPAQPPA